MGRFDDIELSEVELVGDRLTLRRWQPADADWVRHAMQDTATHEFLGLPLPYTIEDAVAFVTGFGHDGRDEGRGLGCAVAETGSGELVGSATLRLHADTAAGADADLGYWIAAGSRGHGYAAEAARVLTGFAFSIGCPRVRIECDVANLASARTALAAGFRFEGVARDATRCARSIRSSTGRSDLASFGRLPEDPDTTVAAAFPALPDLSDGTITLRPVQPADADEVAELDDELARAAGFGGPVRSARDVERSTARAGLDWLVGTWVRTAIVDEATGALAGMVTLRLTGPPQVVAIGYVVHPLFRGRGYTARALRLLVPWAFDAGFARLELGAKVTNLASQRAALAAGFEPDGVRRGRLRNTDGTFGDEARFALVAAGRA